MAGNRAKSRKSSAGRPAKGSPEVVEDESPLEIAGDIMRLALLRVRSEVQGIVDGSIVVEKHDPASRLAWLAKETAPVARELRQAERAQQLALEKLTVQDVKAWLDLHSPEARARVLRELGLVPAPVERRSVLGS